MRNKQGRNTGMLYLCLKRIFLARIVKKILWDYFCRPVDDDSAAAQGRARAWLGGRGGWEDVCQNVPLFTEGHRWRKDLVSTHGGLCWCRLLYVWSKDTFQTLIYLFKRIAGDHCERTNISILLRYMWTYTGTSNIIKQGYQYNVLHEKCLTLMLFNFISVKRCLPWWCSKYELKGNVSFEFH